ncbi:MAG: precorrin-3B C(17)-methyltransferase [Lachnospiraceae bacterium]|nr:precorrin-3B C(17)-methyltransferase [Lachnospiraceae bacterium]
MKGNITVIGIGPGSEEKMTIEAHEALASCSVIAGYSRYVELVKDRYPGKKLLSTGMRGEEERCRLALAEAEKGERVGFVCSGDAGVYGLAGLMIETAHAAGCGIEVRVLPGVTAALSGAALLGAPLTHDCCLISLSDLLTPWETIEKRLRAAAAGDFGIAIYNPQSMRRADYLRRACDILLEQLSPDTVCGIAENIGREGENARVCTLRELRDTDVNMFTTVFIGNRTTKVIDGKMVTPRGYGSEKEA